MSLNNGDIAELLSRASENETEHRRRALRRAARAALWQWDEEAAALRAAGRKLTELSNVGPYIAHLIDEWLAAEMDPPTPPPVRAGFLTLAEARTTLEAHPEWINAYRGDLHMHTTWSDGGASLATMVIQAAARGYEYVGVTDHTKELFIAHGMDEAMARREWEEIRQVAAHMPRGFSILRGLEMNLSPEGGGDMDEELLDELDFLVAAFHSKLREKTDQTERYVRAVMNRHVNILAHPRGRRYDVRLGLLADWDVVALAAAKRDMALEIDSWPDRQDLDVENLRAVAEAGTRIAIDADAHQPRELGFIGFGLAAAIRAGIRMDRVVNFLPVDDLRAWAREATHMARRIWAGADVTGSPAATARSRSTSISPSRSSSKP